MYDSFLGSYDTLGREGMNHNELGAHALQRAARAMKKCLNSWLRCGRIEDQEELMQALRKNQRLWTILQVECSSEHCTIDPTLRRNLLLLSGYVDKTTFGFTAQPEIRKLESLIRINESLVEGLLAAHQPQVAPAAPVAAESVCYSF
jgi:flagellar biosynthesis regulator FlaF